MSEEIEVQEPQEGTPQEKEYSPIELKALEMGWNPDFEGDEADFVDAKEFVGRKPLYDKIQGLSKKYKEVEKTLDLLKEHHGKVKETEYKRAIADLRAAKKDALIEGDADKVLEIEEAIDDVQEARTKENNRGEQSSPEVHPDFQRWVDKNSWYVNNGEMHDFADGVGLAYRNRNPDASPSDVLEYVEKRIRKEYSTTFENPNKRRPSSVETSNNTPTRKGSDSFQLTEQETEVMKKFVRQGVLTKEQYIAQIKSTREV